MQRPPPSEQDASAVEARADRQPVAERRLRGAELALAGARRELERARRQLSELSQRVAALEGELERARAEPQRLRQLLRASERLRREAEQVADAERRERERLERTLASLRHRPAHDPDGEPEARSDALAQRARELERQLRERTRQLDELEHLLAVARRARDRAQARAAALAATSSLAGSVPVLTASTLAAERALAQRPPRLDGPPPASRPAAPAGTPFADALAAERALASSLAAHPGSPAGARVATGSDRGKGAGGRVGEREADGARGVLAALADELDALAELARRERDERRLVQERVAELELELALARRAGARALQITRALAAELRALGAGAARPAEPDVRPRAPGARTADAAVLPEDPAGRVEPELLSAALHRLRNGQSAASDEPVQAADGTAAPPEDGGGEPAREQGGEPAVRAGSDQGTPTPGAWLRRAFGRLARRDPAAAGELALALLPLACAPRGQSVLMDLVIGDGGCFQVSVTDAGAEVRLAAGPRSLAHVTARVSGDTAQLGRLVGSGALARLLGRGRPRVQGSRRALGVLRALADVRVRLGELPERGVQMPPELVLRLVAATLTPQITRGAALTIAHRDPVGGGAAFLSVRDRQRPQAGELTPGVMSSLTVWCESRVLCALLDGRVEPQLLGARVEGAVENLERLRDWIEQAQRA